MLFTGHAECTIDPKQRLQVPAKFRAIFEAAGQAAWYCVPWAGGVLRLYPEKTFQLLSGTAGQKLIPNADEAQLESDFFGLVEKLEPDSAGRVLISKWHVSETKLGMDVVVIGAGNRLEIRDRAKWMETRSERFANLPALAERMNARGNQA